MAKKVTGYIKLQIPAGKATPAPPVGPALGQHGVNIVQFTKEFNARTADKGDLIIPVVITVYADRSFSFITKTPPAAVLYFRGHPDIPRVPSHSLSQPAHTSAAMQNTYQNQMGKPHTDTVRTPYPCRAVLFSQRLS